MGRYFTSINNICEKFKDTIPYFPLHYTLFPTPCVFHYSFVQQTQGIEPCALPNVQYNLHDLMPTLSLVFLERLMSPVH
jgi:hypothetical protein